MTERSIPGRDLRSTFRRGQRLVAAAVVLVATLGVTLVGSVVPAEAHGAATLPGSRTYLCRIDGTSSGGDIEPKNPACAAAVELGGKQPLWDWFGVLRGDGAGRTRGFIPDGQLCSGGFDKYAGYDLPRADWPYTRLTSGGGITFRYNAWAAHPGEFRMYITKDGFDPTKPLAWDDLEVEPFSTYTQTQPNGQDDQNNTPDYQWNATLPAKSGRHIVYSVWERSDSEETFYNCSDVVFDGGNGEVVGLGAGAVPVSAPTAPAAGPTTTAPPTTPPETIPPAGAGAADSTDQPTTTQPVQPGADEAADSASTSAPIDDGQSSDPLAGAVADTGVAPDQTAGTETSPDVVSGGPEATVIPAATDGSVPVPAADDPSTGVELDPTLARGLTPSPQGVEGSSSGPGWLTVALIGIAGIALGAAATSAVMTQRQNQKLRAELDVVSASRNLPPSGLMPRSEPTIPGAPSASPRSNPSMPPTSLSGPTATAAAPQGVNRPILVEGRTGKH